MSDLKDEIWRRLETVMDPELHRPLTELRMISHVEVEGTTAVVGVKLTVQGCPLQHRIEGDVKAALEGLSGIDDVRVELSVMTVEERKSLARGFRPVRESSVTQKDSTVRVLIVGSGKGGVGKSTVTVNVAAAFEKMGRQVGVLDADVYGFSIPRMIGAEKPPVVLSEELILPVDVHGVKVISMGMLVEEDTPVMWRGPMLTKLIEQFLGDVLWGDIDYLVVDAPPGTGDVAITLAQHLNEGKVLLVTTPQLAASRVAARVAQMSKKVGQEVIGIVENMAYYRCPHCGEESTLFGKGGGESLSRELGLPVLGRIPLEAELPERGDIGAPVVWGHPESEAAMAFMEIAKAVDASTVWKTPLPVRT